jgi:hypothetical protein
MKAELVDDGLSIHGKTSIATLVYLECHALTES